MWTTYFCIALAILGAGAALFCYRLYKDAIKRELCTSEVLCAVLLSPVLESEFRNATYNVITDRFPPDQDYPSELEISLLQIELMSKVGNSAYLFSSGNGIGATLRRVLSGPSVIIAREAYARNQAK
jgi:hypothetical protein